MRPVLLLGVGPVVLVARPAPREGDLVLDAVVEQVGVDELRAVVGVDPEDREGKDPAGVLDRFCDKDRRLVSAPSGSPSSPWPRR